MDFRKLSDADLVNFTENLSVQAPTVAGTVIPAALLTSVDSAKDSLSISTDASLNAISESQSVTETKNLNRNTLIAKLAQIKQTMRANQNPKSDFELLGFGALDFEPTPINAQAPSSLVATGDSTNRNYLRWKGNNKSGSVVYVIEFTAGDTQSFSYLANTKSQKFTHTNVTPGQVYQYRVKAQAAKTESAWSNTAVVYGQ